MVEYEEVIMMTEETSIPIAKFSFEIFNKIKVAESLNDVDLSGLHHKEIIQLETIMTTDKIYDLYRYNIKFLNGIIIAISSYLSVNEISSFNFESLYNQYQQQFPDDSTGKSTRVAIDRWMENDENEFGGKFILSTVKSGLCAAIILIRILVCISDLAARNGKTNSAAESGPPSLSLTTEGEALLSVMTQEHMEQTLSLLTRFLIENRLVLGIGGSSTAFLQSANTLGQTNDATDVSSGTASNEEVRQTGHPFVVEAFSNELCPLFITLLGLFDALAYWSPQSDSVVLSMSELALRVLALDPASNPRAELVRRHVCDQSVAAPVKKKTRRVTTSARPDTKRMITNTSLHPKMDRRTHLGRLHLVAVGLLRTVFQHYPSHRSVILQDMLPLLAQVYTRSGPRIVSHSYPLYSGRSSSVCDSSNSDTSDLFISMAVAALLTILQASLDLSPSRTALTNTTDPADTMSPNIPNENAAPVGNRKTRQSGKGVSKRQKDMKPSPQDVQASENKKRAEDFDPTERMLLGTRKLCSLFISNILKRCANSNTQSEYRPVLSALAQHLLLAVPSPEFPVAALLLEYLVLHLQRAVSEAVQQSSAPQSAANTNTNSSLMSGTISIAPGQNPQNLKPEELKSLVGCQAFYMDTLTAVGSGLRSLSMADEGNVTAKEDAMLPNHIRQSLGKKLIKLEGVWLARIRPLLASEPSIARLLAGNELNLSTGALDFESEATVITPDSTVLPSSGKRKLKGKATSASKRGVQGRDTNSIEDSAKKPKSNSATVSSLNEANLLKHGLQIAAEVTALAFQMLSTVEFSDPIKNKLTSVRTSDQSNSDKCSVNLPQRSDSEVMSCITSGIQSKSTSSSSSNSSGIDQDYLEPSSLSSGTNAKIWAMPTPAAILRQCGVCDDLVRLVQRVPSSQLASFSTAEHLRQPTLSNNSTHNEEVSLLAIRNEASQDSLTMHLALWASDAGRHKRFDEVALTRSWLLQTTGSGTGRVAPETATDSDVATDVEEAYTNDVAVLSSPLLSKTNDPNTSALSMLSGDEHSLKVCVQNYFNSDMMRFQYRHAIVSRQLSHRFESILRALLMCFSSTSPLIRARTIKCLASLTKVNESLITRKLVRDAIVERFDDMSISVREEAVKLVGTYVLRGCAVSSGYMDALLERLRDKGVSVRKAVVAIVRDILLHQPDNERYSELCHRLMERAALPKEEDSIKDLVRATFQQAWFTPVPATTLTAAAKQRVMIECERLTTDCSFDASIGVVSTVETPSSAGQTTVDKSTTSMSLAERHIESTAIQIVDVLALSTKQTWLVQILREMLHKSHANGEEGQKGLKSRRDASLRHCEQLVAQLVETLLRAEEGDSALLRTLQGKRSLSDELVAVVLALATFSEAHPPLLLPHLQTLIPYLKGSAGLISSQAAVVIMKVVEILSSVLVIDGLKLGFRAADVTNDLVNIALKHNAGTVSSAVHCLSLLGNNVTGSIAPVYDLADRMVQSVLTIVNSVSGAAHLAQAQVGRLLRCLVVLGAVCEHYKKCMSLYQRSCEDEISTLSPHTFEQLFVAMNEAEVLRPLHTVQLNPRIVVGITYSIAIFCLDSVDLPLQARAVQTLCSVFVGCPKLIIHAQDIGILSRILSDQFPATVIEKMLGSLQRMMRAEEQRLETKEALSQMGQSGISIGSRVLGPADHELDLTVAGFILQHHLHTILCYLTFPQRELRVAALGLIHTLLQQGMLCPLDILSYLITLLGDIEPDIRRQALQLLQEMDEKYPNFLESRILDGMNAICRTQLQLHGRVAPTETELFKLRRQSEGGEWGDEEPISNPTAWSASILKPLYLSCVQSSRKLRSEFLGTLLRRTHTLAQEMAPTTQGVTSSALLNPLRASTVAIFSFYASTIAHLPYEHSDEPLLIVHWINRNVPLACVQAMSRIRNLLVDYHLVSVAPVVADDGSLPLEATKAAFLSHLSTNQNYVEVVSVLSSIFSQLRGYAILLQLKAFLKTAYALSDEKCSQFSPLDRSGALDRSRLLDGCLPLTCTGLVPERSAFLYSQLEAKDGTDELSELFWDLASQVLTSCEHLQRVLDGSCDRDFTLSVSKRRKTTSTAIDGDALVVGKRTGRTSAVVKKKRIKLCELEPIAEGDEWDNESDEDYKE